jgi:RNA:NAD 2'-phosphotransferase (TPT1/KptA family)
MARIDGDPNCFLYHGTLRRNVPSIRETGLQPQRGLWAARFHPNAAALVYAVDDEHRSAAILAVAGQMAKAGLVRVSESYLFDDFKNDLIEHGAILVVKACTFRRYPWSL